MSLLFTAGGQSIGYRGKAVSNWTERRRRSGQQRMRWLDGITDTMDMSLSKLQKIAKNREAWHAAVHELDMTE